MFFDNIFRNVIYFKKDICLKVKGISNIWFRRGVGFREVREVGDYLDSYSIVSVLVFESGGEFMGVDKIIKNE